MIESVLLGAVQGIFEWLPISSEGALVFLQVRFFETTLGVSELVRLALFLHLGTFLAALVYFRREVLDLFRALVFYRRADVKEKKLVRFYVVATAVSALVGLFVLNIIDTTEPRVELTGRAIIIILGVLLLVTGALQFVKRIQGAKGPEKLTDADGVLLGVVQGISVLPGLSRSGLTVSALLLRRFEDTHALTMSFILSLPAVLGGNILLNKDILFTPEALAALTASFVFGITTIHALLKIAKRVHFGWFVLGFAGLVFLSAIVI